MSYYCYNNHNELGSEGLGSAGKLIIHNLKTVKGVINRCKSYGWNKFSIYSFTNFYKDETFKFITKI